MSNFGAPKDLSFLPEDLEKRLVDIENHITNLTRRKVDLETVISQRNSELLLVTKEKEKAVTELSEINALYEGKKNELNSRELSLMQRDEILTKWAGDLEKKEKQINRYLAIFENMKNVIKTD